MKNLTWTEKENNILYQMWSVKNLDINIISKELNRTESALKNQITKLKLKRPNGWHINKELEQNIIKLYKKGMTNRNIAKELKRHNTTINYHIKRNKLIPNGNGPKKIEMVSQTHAKCSKCNNIKTLECFYIGRKNTEGEYRLSYCNECKKKQQRELINNDKNKFLEEKYRRLKMRSKKLNILFNINKDDFIEQYFSQNGKCFYSDVEMRMEVGNGFSWNSLSVDKIIPENGYRKGNVVFCTNKINTAKSDFTLKEMKEYMPNWYNKIQKFLIIKRIK